MWGTSSWHLETLSSLTHFKEKKTDFDQPPPWVSWLPWCSSLRIKSQSSTIAGRDVNWTIPKMLFTPFKPGQQPKHKSSWFTIVIQLYYNCHNCLCPSKAAGTCPQVVLAKGQSCDWDTGLSSTGPRLKTNTWWAGKVPFQASWWWWLRNHMESSKQSQKVWKVIERCSGILHFFCPRRKRIVQYCMDGARFDLQVMAFHCLWIFPLATTMWCHKRIKR